MSQHIIQASYQFAQTLSAANTSRILGPPGLRGTLTSFSVLCTTSLTGSTGLLSIGTSGIPTQFATLTLPNTTAPAKVDGVVVVQQARGIQAGIGPDEVVELTNDAAPGAGAGIIFITIDWK